MGAIGAPFDQTAAHNRCYKFLREAVVKTSKLLDGDQFEASELEGAGRYQLLKLRYSQSLLSKTAFLRIRVVDFKGHTHLLLLTNAGPFGIAS